MTKNEALKIVRDLNRQGVSKYCPMAKATCRYDCICLSDAYMVEHSSGDRIVHDRKCTNKYLIGDI